MKRKIERGPWWISRETFLRERIEETGMSYRKFAQVAGIPLSTLSSILQHGIASATLDNVFKICDALKVDVDYLGRGFQSGVSESDLRVMKSAMNISIARRALRFRKEAIAAMLDISPAHYDWFESTHFHVPIKYIKKLASIFNVSEEFLFGDISTDPKIEEELGSMSFLNLPDPEKYEGIDIGATIKKYRLQAGINAEELAESLNVPMLDLEYWEERIKIPTEQQIFQIIDILKIEYSELLSTRATFVTQPILDNDEIEIIDKFKIASEEDREVIRLLLKKYG